MAIKNESFAQAKHIQQASQKMFELVKKWGATPFDGFETVSSSQAGSASTVPTNDDSIVYGNDHFYLKQKQSDGTFKYLQSWSTASLYYDGSSLRTDRLFASKEGYIINGEVYAPDMSRVDTLESIVGTSTSAGLQKKVSDLEKADTVFSSRLTAVEGKATTNASNITLINTTLDDKADQTDVDALSTIVANTGATYYDKHIFGTLTVDATEVTKDAEDKIIYSDENKRFLLERKVSDASPSGYSVKYYSIWNGVSAYNDASTGKRLVNKFFVSPIGYIINGSLFYHDLSGVVSNSTFESFKTSAESSINALESGKADKSNFDAFVSSTESSITTLGTTKANQADLNALSAKLGLPIVPFGGILTDATVVEMVYNKSVNASSVLYVKAEGKKVFVILHDGKYKTGWVGSDKYNAVSDGKTVARNDSLFVSKDGYVILGDLYSPDLSAIQTEINKKADSTYVNTELSKKLDTSVFTTKEAQITQALNGKASTQQLSALTSVVNTKADKSALDTLTTEVSAKASQDDLNEAREVWSASLNELNSRITGALKRSIVAELPTSGMDSNTIYMVVIEESSGTYCNEYMWDADNERYILIGTSQTDLSSYTSHAEMNRYIASNQGVRYLIHPPITGETDNVAISLKQGDKIKVERLTGTFTTVEIGTFEGTTYSTIASNVAVGSEYTLTADLDNISIRTMQTGNYNVRLFITNSTLSFDIMSEDDINEIFENLS